VSKCARSAPFALHECALVPFLILSGALPILRPLAHRLVAQMHGTQRSLELMDLVALDSECSSVGCNPTDDASAPQCATDCLQPCELRLHAVLTGRSDEITYNNENWICRRIAEGYLSPNKAEHFYRYSYVASVFGQIAPANVIEYIFAYLMAFSWLMMQNAFIGILCGTIADGDKHAKEYKHRMSSL
jgi:hypothetical protein